MLVVSPLVRLEVDTTDPEQGHQWIRESYAEHVPRVSGDPAGFRMRVSSAATDLFRIDEALYTMRLAADVAPYGALYMNRVRRGGYWTRGPVRRVERGPGEIALMDPARPSRTGWERIAAQVVVLDLAASCSIVEGLTGVPAERVTFELSEPLDEDRARYWTAVVDHVATSVLALDDVVAQPLVRAEAFRSLVTATLLTFPNPAMARRLERAPPGTARTEPAALRRAVEFIEAHPHEPIGLVDIVESARISPRALQYLFRRHRDTTPLGYLRQVRLALAHHDLRAADPTRGATVAAVAARWGFSNPGRFSVEYRKVHGRSPGETLHQ